MDLSILEKIVIGIAVVALILFVTFKILGVLQTNELQYVRDLAGTTETATCNATSGAYAGCTGDGVTAIGTLITAIGTIPTWISVTIVVAVGGFLIMYLRKGFSKQGGSY
jgi:hypothetical protein